MVATIDRWAFVADLLVSVSAQGLLPIEVVVASPQPAPIALGDGCPFPVVTPMTERGLTVQRNAGVRAVTSGARYVVFLDDDVILHPGYLRSAVELFESDPGVAAMTGLLALDGAAERREVTYAEVMAVLGGIALSRGVRPTRSLYGCNFGVRSEILRTEGFDERLPLYGWLEDRDFSGRAARHGKLVVAEACVAVHRGANSGGRLSNGAFGYSQVVNPVYLRRKGSIRRRDVMRLLGRGLPLNLVSLVSGRGARTSSFRRLIGNVRGYKDLLTGRVTPERAARL